MRRSVTRRGSSPALTRFLESPSLPLDNKLLRTCASRRRDGQEEYLFVVTDAAGENIAGLQSLGAACEANGISREEFLADLLMRVQTHPNARIDELLPHRWQPPSTVDSSWPPLGD